MAVQFTTALICEDIRREENGKLSLSGVFGGEIVVDRLPAVLVLSFLVIANVAVAIDCEVDFRLRLDDVTLFEGKGKITPKAPGRSLLPIGRQLVKIAKPGILRFEERPAGSKWRLLLACPVRSAEITSPEAPARIPLQQLLSPVSRKPVKFKRKPRPLVH